MRISDWSSDVCSSDLAGFGYYATLIGVFVTSLYSFRVYFLVFHGKERFDAHADAGHGHGHDAHDDHGHHGGAPKESPWVVTLPLVLLAIPSVIAGAWRSEERRVGKEGGSTCRS